MPQLGPLEILVIFVVALLVFGPSKLPEIGRQVGRGVQEFRKFQHGLRRELDGVLGHDEHDDVSAEAQPAPTLPPREPKDWSEPTESPEPDDRSNPGAFTNPGAPPSSPTAPTAPAAPGEPGDPMLPLPWPDAVPPPPPPDDVPPVDPA